MAKISEHKGQLVSPWGFWRERDMTYHVQRGTALRLRKKDAQKELLPVTNPVPQFEDNLNHKEQNFSIRV